MANKTFYGEEARIKILKGAANIYEAVSVTAGKHGQNVTISGPYGPSSTHDGVKVAMSYNPEITEETLGEEAGSDFVRAAAAKTNDTVGDGTTASTILTYHLIREAYKLVAAGHNPMVLKRELDEATEEMLANIPSLTEEIKGDIKRITQVATISAGDYEIGKLIAEVISEIGEDGAVSVETSDTIGLNKEITQGYKFDRGYIALSQITDPSKMVASYSDVPILITDRKITTFWEIQPLLEEIAKSGKKELVIIADDVDGEALSTLVLNHHKGLFKTVCIKAPAMGERRHDLLEDIAIATGGIVISEEVGLDFRSANMDCLGYAKRIIVTRDSTTIIDGQGDHEVIADRTSLIKELLTSASSGDKPLIERRLAALIGKAGVIRVGGITEGEIDRREEGPC
jgi:chaperonin GroEL